MTTVKGQDMDRFHDVFRTRLGWVGVVASDRGVRRTTLPQASPADCMSIMGREAEGSAESPAKVAALRDRIEAYLEGERVGFEDEAVGPRRRVVLSQGGLVGVSFHSLRRDTHVQVAGRADRQAAGAPRSGPGDGPEPAAHRRAVPPGRGQRRQPARLRPRRLPARPQAAPDRSRDRRLADRRYPRSETSSSGGHSSGLTTLSSSSFLASSCCSSSTMMVEG